MAKSEDEEKAPKKVTDIDAVEDNVSVAVMAFNERWMPWPRFDLGVEVMDVGQLRDAMGLSTGATRGRRLRSSCWTWVSVGRCCRA